jgi:hypothetical protein
MVKKYFFKLGGSFANANKMDAEINEFILTLDGSLINSEDDLKKFKQAITDKVEEIHRDHPRCKNIPLSIWSFSKVDESLTCGCSRGTIYDILQEFKTQS